MRQGIYNTGKKGGDSTPEIADTTIDNTNVGYATKGITSVEGLDQHFVSRLSPTLLKGTTALDLTTLNLPDNMTIVVHNESSTQIRNITWDQNLHTGEIAFVSNKQPVVSSNGLYALPSSAMALIEFQGDKVEIIVSEQPVVKTYVNMADAVITTGHQFNTIIHVGEGGGTWVRKTGSLESFLGVENTHWTRVDKVVSAIDSWQPNTEYAPQDRFVAPMPLNADFIANNGAIANLNYIFQVNTNTPNTITAFDEAQADSGNYNLVGVYRINGLDDRVLSGSGIMLFDPLNTLSNSAKNEFIHWTTTDNPQVIRVAPAPAFITLWKDYTGNNLVQPTSANEDFTIPADTQMWAYRVGNAIQIRFESNEGSGSGETFGTIASNEIGTLKQVPNVKEDGTLKVNQDYIDAGLLPLINGYTLTNGATDNPKFALMFPSFVSGNDLTVPNTFDGNFVRNLGGNAGVFIASQSDATAANGLALRRVVNVAAGTNRETVAASGTAPITGDSETRPINFAMQFCLVLDSYSKVLMVNPDLVQVEDVGGVVFKLNEWIGSVGISNGAQTTVNTGMDWSNAEYFEVTIKDIVGTDQKHKTYRGDISTITGTTGQSLLMDRFGGQYIWMNNLDLATGIFLGQIQGGGAGWVITRVTLWGEKTLKSVIKPEDLPTAPQANWNDGDAGVWSAANNRLEPSTNTSGSIDYHQGDNVEFVITGKFFSGKQVYGRSFEGNFTISDNMIPAGIADDFVGSEGWISSQYDGAIVSINSADRYVYTPYKNLTSGAIGVRLKLASTGASVNRSARNAKFTLFYTKI